VIELFVTGTDTGVGKTTVACALLAAARARGLRTRALKPVETGCAREAGILQPADAIALDRAAGNVSTTADSATVYRFAAPLAPSVAAEREGQAVALAPILRAADRLRSLSPDLLVIEGAGGLLVPLTSSVDMADLAAALAIPLLIVARDGLGTINHTLLTLEAAAARQLPVAAVVLSAANADTTDVDATRNAAEIARRGRVPVLGRLPHLGSLSPEELGRAAEAHLDLTALLGSREATTRAQHQVDMAEP
jgi:dethiobiotin synthetase